MSSSRRSTRSARTFGPNVRAILLPDLYRVKGRCGPTVTANRGMAGVTRSNPATLQTIADDLGLHVSTVARVLNGMREGERAASGATAERIRKRAAEVNYRP